MKTRCSFTRPKNRRWPYLVASLLFLGSCTQGLDVETFSPGVENTTLQTPESFTVAATPDGTGSVISWDVVYGAGGYQISLYDINDESNPIALVENRIVDGNSVTVDRAEDTNYRLVFKTLGNADYNNQESSETEFLFTTIVPKINESPIPAGTDITQWFADNQELIAGQAEEYALELTSGQTYTMSGEVEIGNVLFTLRSSDKTNPATIEMGANSGFCTETGIKFKNVNFNCTGMTENTAAILKFSKNHSYEKTVDSYLIGVGKPVVFQGCKITDLSACMIWDQNENYVIDNLLISECIIELDQVQMGSRGTHSIWLGQSFPMTFSVNSSTVYTKTVPDANVWAYFLVYRSSRPQQLVGGMYPTCTINWLNSTFYQLSKAASGKSNGFCNYGRLKGQSVCILNVKNNLFVDCSSNMVVRRTLMQNQNGGMTATFENNCYWYDGAPTVSDYDRGDRVNFDPQLTQTSEGYFTVGGAEIKAAGLGDPRGLQ